jgi:hypothetical protein
MRCLYWGTVAGGSYWQFWLQLVRTVLKNGFMAEIDKDLNMLDCLVIGDSIAVGVAMIRTECLSYAKSGWNSSRWNKEYLHLATKNQYETVIISLGANDSKNIDTEAELRKMRSTIRGKRVFWISPGRERKPQAQAAMEAVAAEYGDTILARPKEHMSADGVHPTMRGYRELADRTR